MKITTEPQSIYVKAFDQTYNFGTVWLNEKGDICFCAGASAQSEIKTFTTAGRGLWPFIDYIRGERDSIRTQLTKFANQVSK